MTGIPVPTPAGLAKEIIAELIAEHGWDAVKKLLEKLRPKKKPGGGGVVLLVAALALSGKRKGRGRR